MPLHTEVQRSQRKKVGRPEGSKNKKLPPSTRADPLYTRPEAAQYLRRSLAWLDRARQMGGGPSHLLVGGTVLYAESKLETFLAECERGQP